MQLYGQEPIKENYHLAKFDGHLRSGNGDIVFLICHMISQDYMIEGSCNFISKIGKSSLMQVTILPSLVRKALWQWNNNLICHAILQDHMIKAHVNLWAGSH